MNSYPALAAWAFAAGALIPVMGILNAGLGRVLGSAPLAGVVLFVVALAAAVLVTLVSRPTMPILADMSTAPIRLCFGGLIVAFYVLSVTILVPRFGVGNTILFAMTAQIFSSAAIDHFGLFGAQIRPVGVLRSAGLLLMIAGLFIAQLSVTRGPT
jgi:bacterial/archaeal transporter family-2 protein